MSRKAQCVYCGAEAESSNDKLAFFKDKGEGSPSATEICGCGYHQVAHEPGHGRVDPRTVMQQGKCKTGFVARGAQSVDEYYCGCRGWG